MTKNLVPTPSTPLIKQPRTFHEDVPITSIGADVLGRGEFAKDLADRIKAQRPEKTLIIAITGEWGSGKSSFLNLLEHELNARRTWWQKWLRHGKVVRFAPSYFEDTQDLLALLAEEITERWKWIRRPWRGFLLQLQRHAFSLIVLIAFLALVSFGLETCRKDVITASCPTLATLLFPFNTTLFFSFLAFFATTQLIKRSPHEEIKRLSVKRCLLLKGCCQPPPQIIFIDELDRWDGTSVRELINFIKINTTFENKIFVLAFDKDVVSKHLTENDVPGHIYLEKIIQYELKLPTIGGWTLREVLNKKLREISKAERWQEACQGNRYDYILDEILSVELTTMRDVHRYINAVSFSADFAVRDLDIQDYLIVELLKLKHSDVFNELYKYKHILTHERTTPSNTKERRESPDFENLLKNLWNLESKSSSLNKCLTALFPILRDHHASTSSRNELFRSLFVRGQRTSDLVISDVEFFDRYFTLAIAPDQLSDAEIKLLLQKTNKEDAFRQYTTSPLNFSCSRYILTRLGACSSDLLQEFVPAILVFERNIIPHTSVPKLDSYLLLNNTAQEQYNFIKTLSQKIALTPPLFPSQRDEAWAQIIDEIEHLFLLVHASRWLDDLGPQNSVDLKAADIQAFNSKVLRRIKADFSNGSLFTIPNSSVVLEHWIQKGEDSREILKHFATDDTNFITLCEACVTKERTLEGLREMLPLNSFQEIFGSRDLLIARLQTIANASNKDLSSRAIEFLERANIKGT